VVPLTRYGFRPYSWTVAAPGPRVVDRVADMVLAPHVLVSVAHEYMFIAGITAGRLCGLPGVLFVHDNWSQDRDFAAQLRELSGTGIATASRAGQG
jgi:hypothetical protein